MTSRWQNPSLHSLHSQLERAYERQSDDDKAMQISTAMEALEIADNALEDIDWLSLASAAESRVLMGMGA